jgi:hypothetical protein
MPVKAEDAAESLKPVGIGEALEHVLRPELLDNGQSDLAAERDHAFEEPGWRFTAVQGRVGDTGSSGHHML